jgi:hypothetical protein
MIQTKSVEIEIIRLIGRVSVISVHLPNTLRSTSLFIVSLAPRTSRALGYSLFSLFYNQALYMATGVVYNPVSQQETRMTPYLVKR